MLLKDLFGDTARIKILEELISNWDLFLSVDEIARMADVSKKSVYVHMEQLKKIGIVIMEDNGSKKFKLDPKDKRAIALALIESDEYLRKMEEYELELENNAENAEYLHLSTSSNDDIELLSVNSQKINNALKGIPLITFVM
ncbi:winged helix-turn-helix domain-containing protein [Methanobrevibacter sp.]|uniref:winged helix-turn-helix domain-containing protein n=1 Tax=Methanobrevibacter sp. TaxID=66852 RepID=UPI00386A2E3C